MQDNIETIISNALTVNKDNLKEIKSIIELIKKALKSNKEAIIQANEIDIKNNNGFIIDFDIIKRIFSNVKKRKMYGDVTLSKKDNDVIYGKQIMDIGNVVVITDGNPYVIIEMAIRNIMAGNTTIFTNDGYMFGTNKLIIQIIQTVLEQFSITNLIQIYIAEDCNEILSNYANIDLVICIGDHYLQRKVLKKSKNKTIISGYEHFDLYIEDKTNKDFLNKIIKTRLDIQLYINSKTGLDHSKAIIVDTIDEAIAQINYNGNGYSSAIFTTSTENASKFIKEVKSKIVTVNTSPTIERIIDIKQSELTVEKTIVYPNSFEIESRVEINKDND